ncbi:outer membrane beta-barrel protein [Hymenobacter cellulosivorans]|uniref:PorT family protein n=1 Tax=Hymenobacter cellulosivorans TaxID=2932249 RepID=A0ABY4F9V7_9BACT|nr:outer membrane beta-barrel protein [Hymenobacter cellulosivorans]UOQ52887.1 PorT family protein [Hymenobacter cellulosivorans]
MLLAAAPVLTPHAVQAQGGPQKGYIVPLVGDTVRGTIVLGRAQRNALQCEFKATGQTETKTYKVGELRGYGSPFLTYENQLVPRSADTATVLVPRYLEVVTRGPLTLYALSYEGKPRFFISGYRPGKMVELIQRTNTVRRGEQQFVVTQRLYQDTLAKAFQSCPEQARKAKYVGFGVNELGKIVLKYNACVAPGAAIKANSQHGNLALGVVGGVSVVNQLILGKNTGEDEVHWKYGGNAYISAGLAAVFTPGFKGAPFTIHSGLIYERSRTFTSDHNFFPTIASKQSTELQLNYLVVPAMVRYSVGHGVVRPYAEVGPSVRFLLHVGKDEKVYTLSSGSTQLPVVSPLLGEYNNFNFGIGGGLGAEMHLPNGQQIGLGIRAENVFGPSTYTSGSSVRSAVVVLEYIFTK